MFGFGLVKENRYDEEIDIFFGKKGRVVTKVRYVMKRTYKKTRRKNKNKGSIILEEFFTDVSV